LPEPLAIHVPLQARKTGSSAVTTPLAGISTLIDLSFSPKTCMYGSRFETTYSGLSCNLLRKLTRSRSAVQSEAFELRSRASSSAAARAVVRS
jgi:hypothetical protein